MSSFGGVGGRGNVGGGGRNSSGELVDAQLCTDGPPCIASTTKVALQNLDEAEKGGSSGLLTPPALHVAAREGRSAMELVHRRTPTLATDGSGAKRGERRQQLQLLRDGIGHHRQSLKQAAESLLKATKATGVLADSIAQIRGQRIPSATDLAAQASISSVQELHGAFLSLTQSLLDCLDPHPSVSSSSISKEWQRRSSKTTSSLPGDDQLIELLLILSYRSHQLSLPFHWPLYQRMALTLAHQPHIATLRSRAEWIWNIHQWSQSTWGPKSEASVHPQEEHRQRQHQDRIDWFRPSLLALAEGQLWSDLNYLLRYLLQPPFAKLRNDGDQSKLHSSRKRGNRKSTRSGTVFTVVETPTSSTDRLYLDKYLTRSLLMAFDRHGVLPNLWKNLRHPSPREEDVLEILLLLETSIWKIFEHPANLPARVISIQNGKKGSEQSVSSSPEDTRRFSLREAIEVVLRTAPDEANGDPAYGMEDDSDDADDIDDFGEDYDTFALTLQDLEDMLRNGEELRDDEDDSQGQSTPDIVSLATLLCDPFWQGKGGKHRPLNSSKRLPRDLEVRVTRSGDYHVLEVAGLANDSASSSIIGKESADRASWDYDESTFADEASEFIYSRVESYPDAIPDVTHQLFQHNGNQKVRYSSSLEQEIYLQFQNQPPGYFDGDEHDEEDSENPVV